MRRDSSRVRAIGLVAGMLAIAVALACAGTRGDGQAPGQAFHSIEDVQLESSMGQLAAGVVRLRAIFADPRPLDPGERREVVAILDEMILAADALGPDAASTSHPQIAAHLDRFREKLAIAQRSASMNPPRYYLVGNLAGTCLACHSGD